MIRFVLVATFVLVASPVFAQTTTPEPGVTVFNLALLNMGPVTPIYIESDSEGLKLAIVHAHDTRGLFLVNPRRRGMWGTGSAFCYEHAYRFPDVGANPKMNIVASTVNVNGKVFIQLVDYDLSDGNAPWVLIEPTFQYCR